MDAYSMPTIGSIGDSLSRKKRTYIWLVFRRYETGKVERAAAYFDEEKARSHAAKIASHLYFIGIDQIVVHDEPPNTQTSTD